MQNKKDILFYKFSAAGNDFILIDNRKSQVDIKDSDFFRRICRRRTAVGADGVLLIEDCADADFKLRYVNSDGSETECGNGARSAAYFACRTGIAESQTEFVFGQHRYGAEVNGETVKLKMPNPFDVRLSPGILAENGFREGGFVNSGVPHYVIFTDSVDINVGALGKKYRNHAYFEPDGTNVDFVKVLSDTEIQIRTYERGVEAETLSCGTGCIASALISHQQSRTNFPTQVRARGGVLRVSYEDGAYFLEGSVHLIYEGKLNDGP